MQTLGCRRDLQVQDAEAGPTTQHSTFAVMEMCYGREVVQPAVETETTTQHSVFAVMEMCYGREVVQPAVETETTTQHSAFAVMEMCYGREVVQPAVETETTTQHSTDAVMVLFAGIVVNVPNRAYLTICKSFYYFLFKVPAVISFPVNFSI